MASEMLDLPDDPECWPTAWSERFDERAAFHEFEGGLMHEESERMAEVDIRKKFFMQQARRLDAELRGV